MKARLMTVLALSVLTPLAGADDPKDAVKMPDTPAGRMLAGWLGALGTGKPETLERLTILCSHSRNARTTPLHRRSSQPAAPSRWRPAAPRPFAPRPIAGSP